MSVCMYVDMHVRSFIEVIIEIYRSPEHVVMKLIKVANRCLLHRASGVSLDAALENIFN